MDDFSCDKRCRNRGADAPLTTVAERVGAGYVRRLWFFEVDDDGRIDPDVQQLDGIPVSPDADAVFTLQTLLNALHVPGDCVIVVLERPLGPEPTPDDWAWHDTVHRAANAAVVHVSAMLLAHAAGVDPLRPGAPRLR